MPSELFDHTTCCSRLGSGIMHRMRNKDSCARVVGKKGKWEQLHRGTCRDDRDKELRRYWKKLVYTCPWRVYLRHHELMGFIYLFVYD